MVVHIIIPIIPYISIMYSASLAMLKCDRRNKSNKEGFINHIILKAFYTPSGINKYKTKQNI